MRASQWYASNKMAPIRIGHQNLSLLTGLGNAACKCAMVRSNYLATEFNIFALFFDRFLTKFVFSFQVSGNLL